MKNYNYIIIGNSAAGISSINKLWRLELEASVLCVSDEKEKPYNKCFLADYLSGGKAEDQLFTKVFHSNANFSFGKRVLAIDPAEKQIKMSDNASHAYDKLLIATGSSPAFPPIPGTDAEGVFTFHSLSDTNNILSYISNGDFSHVTIIGAGLSGLEAADALRSQNLAVTIVERADQVLPNQIDREASTYIEQKMKDRNISVLLSCTVQQISKNQDRVTGICLTNGTEFATDIVICATGLKPNSELAVSAGLRMINDSIWVNEYQQTSNEHIYAAGDVVMVKDQLTNQMVRSATWPDAMHQGLIAAQAMVGQPKPYPGIIQITSSSFFGVKFAACGTISNSYKREDYTIVSCKGTPDEYCKMFVRDGIPVGFVVIGSRLPQLTALRRSVLLGQPYATPSYRPLSL